MGVSVCVGCGMRRAKDVCDESKYSCHSYCNLHPGSLIGHNKSIEQKLWPKLWSSLARQWAISNIILIFGFKCKQIRPNPYSHIILYLWMWHEHNARQKTRFASMNMWIDFQLLWVYPSIHACVHTYVSIQLYRTTEINIKKWGINRRLNIFNATFVYFYETDDYFSRNRKIYKIDKTQYFPDFAVAI